MSGTLFDAPPPVRASDPATSREGAQAPHLPRQRGEVLVVLCEQGRATKWTVAERLGVESGTASSRLSQLVRMGLARECGTAVGPKCRPVTVFAATDAGREWVEVSRG